MGKYPGQPDIFRDIKSLADRVAKLEKGNLLQNSSIVIDEAASSQSGVLQSGAKVVTFRELATLATGAVASFETAQQKPTHSPIPVVAGSNNRFDLTWQPELSATEVVYEVHMSHSPSLQAVPGDVYSYLGEVTGTTFTVHKDIDGSDLQYWKVDNSDPQQPIVTPYKYYFQIIAKNGAGAAAHSPTVEANLVQVSSSDLSETAITTGHLVAGTALVGAMDVVGLDADWIRAGKLNVDRLSIGQSPISSILNYNMEDPYVDADGTVFWDRFAGWLPHNSSYTYVGSETAAPISGSRSLKFTLPDQDAWQRMITRDPLPVIPGQAWHVSAKVRVNRTMDKSAVPNELLGITFHTSTSSTIDPGTPHDGIDVTWQSVEVVNTIDGGITATLTSEMVVPPGHRHMKISVYSLAAEDGSGYTCVWDEVHATAALNELSVINSAGEIAASVTNDGDLLVRDVQYSGTFYADPTTFNYGGQTLEERLDQMPRGVVGYGQRAIEQSGITTEYGLLEIRWTSPPDANLRMYAMFLEGVVSCTFSGAESFGSYVTRVRYTSAAAGSNPSTPTLSSPQMTTRSGTGTEPLGERHQLVRTEAQEFRSFAYDLTVAPSTTYRFLLTGNNGVGVSALNFHQLIRMIVQDMGPRPANSGVKNTGGGTAGGSDTSEEPVQVAKQYTATWSATDTKWWTAGGTFKGAGSNQYFGNTSNTGEGNRKSVIWFNKTSILNTLSDAISIDKVELYLYIFDGGRDNVIAIGKHNDTTPGSNSYSDVDGANRQLQTVSGWSEGTGRWVNLTASGLKSGWETPGGTAGFVIGPESNQTDKYAAAYRGATHSLRPKLRITYTAFGNK